METLLNTFHVGKKVGAWYGGVCYVVPIPTSDPLPCLRAVVDKICALFFNFYPCQEYLSYPEII